MSNVNNAGVYEFKLSSLFSEDIIFYLDRRRKQVLK
jgi:hypothetical protein